MGTSGQLCSADTQRTQHVIVPAGTIVREAAEGEEILLQEIDLDE